MPIEVVCNQCGKSYQVPDQRAGQKGKCSCGSEIIVPDAPQPAAFAAPTPESSSPYAIGAAASPTIGGAPAPSMASGFAGAESVAAPTYSGDVAVGQVPRIAREEPNIIMAFILGLVAAVVAAFIWYGVVALTHIQVGIVAIGVGFVVGLGVTMGAGGKGDMRLQILSVLLTLASLGYSEYLIVRHLLLRSKELAEAGFSLPLLPAPGPAIDLIGLSLKSDPLTLVFWAIALWTAFKLPSDKEEAEG